MERRTFLTSPAVAAASAIAAPAMWSPAGAQGCQERLLIVSESGPNHVDIDRAGNKMLEYECSSN